MNKKTVAHAFVAFSLLSSITFAGTLNIPESKPAVTVDVPDSWKPEKIDTGIVIESPDQAVTMYMEVTAAKASDDLLKENLEYLTKEQHLMVNTASMKLTDAKIGGKACMRMSFDGESKEYGPADVGFIVLELAKDRVITITFWFNKKDASAHTASVDKILDSIKPVN